MMWADGGGESEDGVRRMREEGMKGVTQVDLERKANKVTVIGYVDPSKVVSRIAHRTGKRAELWPYVPYDVVQQEGTRGIRAQLPRTCHLRRGSLHHRF